MTHTNFILSLQNLTKLQFPRPIFSQSRVIFHQSRSIVAQIRKKREISAHSSPPSLLFLQFSQLIRSNQAKFPRFASESRRISQRERSPPSRASIPSEFRGREGGASAPPSLTQSGSSGGRSGVGPPKGGPHPLPPTLVPLLRSVGRGWRPSAEAVVPRLRRIAPSLRSGLRNSGGISPLERSIFSCRPLPSAYRPSLSLGMLTLGAHSSPLAFSNHVCLVPSWGSCGPPIPPSLTRFFSSHRFALRFEESRSRGVWGAAGPPVVLLRKTWFCSKITLNWWDGWIFSKIYSKSPFDFKVFEHFKIVGRFYSIL